MGEAPIIEGKDERRIGREEKKENDKYNKHDKFIMELFAYLLTTRSHLLAIFVRSQLPLLHNV